MTSTVPLHNLWGLRIVVSLYLFHDVLVGYFGWLIRSHQTAYELVGRRSTTGQEDGALFCVFSDVVCREIEFQTFHVRGPSFLDTREFSNWSVQCHHPTFVAKMRCLPRCRRLGMARTMDSLKMTNSIYTRWLQHVVTRQVILHGPIMLQRLRSRDHYKTSNNHTYKLTSVITDITNTDSLGRVSTTSTLILLC